MDMRILPVLFLAAFSQNLTACVPKSLDGPTDLSVAPRSDSKGITVRGDRGGLMTGYSMKMMKLRDRGTKVRFAGRCDSACTLYLALPRDQTCIAPGAKFRFHAPSAATRKASLTARDYLLESYPRWVKAWIRSKGGLSRNIITMDYAYARRFLNPCDRVLT